MSAPLMNRAGPAPNHTQPPTQFTAMPMSANKNQAGPIRTVWGLAAEVLGLTVVHPGSGWQLAMR